MTIIEIGSMALQINRKTIKNLRITVLPPDGRVRVSAPASMTDTAIRMAVIGRIQWIRRQQRDFANQARQSERRMLGGECHYLWGRKYRLNVIERTGKHEIKAGRGQLNLYVSPGTSDENRVLVLETFYRNELKNKIKALLEFWQNEIGVDVADWGVKKMKTKWGSCSIQARRIWLNLELAKKPPECLAYILVHELVHLLERKHNEQFKAYMNRFLPDWEERRNLLNNMPLAYSQWAY
ncbi:MAG: M48 family metallopeptidase [Alcaligenaceae bacterium]|nr:M48 family metallopeptidase [Alcaligenaceae bacterium]